mgnify:CR=1 FL=1
MKYLLPTALVFAVFFLVSCNSTRQLVPAEHQPDATFDGGFVHGKPCLINESDVAKVGASLSSKGLRDLTLQLQVDNKGQENIDFDPKKVEITGFDAAGNAQKFKVLTAGQYLRRERNKRVAIAAATVVVVVAAVILVEKNTKNSRKRDRNSGRDHFEWFGGANFAINLFPPIYPECMVRDEHDDGLLRHHTIQPEENLSGALKIRGDLRQFDRILVEVPVGGRYSKFIFEKNKNGAKQGFSRIDN